MPTDPIDITTEDEGLPNLPKRLRKEFEQRVRPVAARTTSHKSPKAISGLHRRHRRRYGM